MPSPASRAERTRRTCAGRARGRLVRDHVRSRKIVLERELRRELQLARVEYRSRRAEQGVGNGRSGQGASGDLQVLNRPGDVIVVAPGDQAIAEVVGAVNRGDLVDVGAVEQ